MLDSIFSKLLSIFIIINLLLYYTNLNLVPIVKAATQFDTTFNIEYSISNSGEAIASYQISLTNRFADTYATEYALEVGSNRIKNITVSTSSNEPIPFNTTTTDNSTIIQVDFQKHVVGKGKSQNFVVQFLDPDASSLHGRVLEINLPRLSQTEGLINSTITITVPKKFDTPSIIHPPQFNLEETDKYYQLSFSQEALSSGITVIFGDTQLFDFTLNYHLENPTTQDALSQIALPPDTPFQKLNYTKIVPMPDSIKADPDGNWIATFLLKPKQKLDVIAQGQVKIFLKPNSGYPQTVPQGNTYTRAQPFWPADDPKIVKIANSLPDAEAIYDYVVDTFTYDYNLLSAKATRKGALQSLENPASALCQDFTDAFIALARAKGIPAREHNGFALTENPRLKPLSLVQDVLHAWPEYYDKNLKRWLPIDPTWGKTTGGIDYFHLFDLNHFTFVIHGLDSSLPYPAGYYKFSENQTKDILVEFSQEEHQPELAFAFDFTLSPLLFFTQNTTAHLLIHNLSGIAYYQLPIKLSSNIIRFDSQPVAQRLLPFSSTTLPVTLSNLPKQTSTTNVNIEINNKIFRHEISVFKDQPPWFYPIATFTLAIITLVFAFLFWSLLVSRFKK